MRIVFNLSARDKVSLTVDGSGPPFSQAGTSMKSRAMRAQPQSHKARQRRHSNTTVPTSLGSHRVPKPRQCRQNSRQWNDLGLIRKIKNTIDMEHVEKLCCLYKSALHLDSYACMPQGQVQQRLAIAGNGRQFLALFSSVLPHAAVTRMKKRNGLEKIRIGDLSDNAASHRQAGASLQASMPPFVPSSPYQSFRNSWPDAAYIAVTSSKASSAFPPVFTFSKTTHTASLEVDRSKVITAPGSI